MSDQIVPTGTFTVVITLTDEIEVLQYEIAVIIYEELSEDQLSDEISEPVPVEEISETED